MSDSVPAATSVHIREATEDDLPRLVELYYQLSRLGSLPEDAPMPVATGQRQALRELQANPRYRCLALEAGGRVEGTLTLYILPNLSHGGRPYAIVENVVVDERCQGHGYGRLLMQRAEELARAAGCYRVALTSNLRRADAHQFYLRLGYAASHQGFMKYEGLGSED